MKRRLTDIHKILVVTLSNLGDVVLTLPVFQSLFQAYPRAELHAVVGPAAREMLELDGRIKKIIVYDKKIPLVEKMRFIASVRRGRYDLIIDLRHSLIGLLGGARFRNSYFDLLLRTTHRVKKHLRALRGLVDEAVSFQASEADTSFRRSVATEKSHSQSGDLSVAFGDLEMTSLSKSDNPERTDDSRRVVIAAVGSKSDIKKWPAGYYAQLLDRLALLENCRVVLVGDKNDSGEAAKVKNLMKREVEDLSGRTNIRELAAVLKSASLLVTNDSAPLHIADALQTPVLAIFGPTDPAKYGPRFASSRVARRPLFCSPCERAQCRYGHECMKDLGVDELYQKAVSILNDDFRHGNLKILVIRLDRIGDLVLSLPAIEAVKKWFPHCELSVMVRPYARGIVDGHPSVDEVIPYHYGKGGRHAFPVGYGRFLKEIIQRRFDIAFVLHPSTRSILLPFLAGIPYRVGLELRGSPVSLLLTKRVFDSRHEGSRHESEYALDVVRSFGIPAPLEKEISVPFFPEHEARVAELLAGASWAPEERIIAIHAGASCPSKRWPRERFAALGDRILRELPHRIAVIGGEEEKALGKYLAAQIGGALDLTGRLDLKELAAFLSRCELLVTNDSGPVHVAAAAGRPTLCLFGRNQAGLSATRWKALGAGHRVIQKDVGCAVCLAHRCTIDFECLRAVSVDEVFENVKEMVLKQNDVGAGFIPPIRDRRAR